MQTQGTSAVGGQSRFFDEGKRRGSLEEQGLKRVGSGVVGSGEGRKGSAGVGAGAGDGKENEKGVVSAVAGKTRPSNPIGSASAFAWMNK